MSTSATIHDLNPSYASPKKSPGNAEEPELRDRLLVVAEALLEGKSRREIVPACVRLWGISSRTAYWYIRRAQRDLAREAAKEDRFFYLRLSQLQRDKLLRKAYEVTRKLNDFNPQAVRRLTDLMKAASKMLDGRDKTAAQLHALADFKRTEEKQRAFFQRAYCKTCGRSDQEPQPSAGQEVESDD